VRFSFSLTESKQVVRVMGTYPDNRRGREGGRRDGRRKGEREGGRERGKEEGTRTTCLLSVREKLNRTAC